MDMSEISPILVLPTNKISDMTKAAIKNENITSYGGIYHIMDVFSKLGFERQGRQARQGTDGYVRSDIHIPLYTYQ